MQAGTVAERESMEYARETLRVVRMRQGLGQATEQEVRSVEDDYRRERGEYVYGWWRKLSAEDRPTLRQLHGQPVDVVTRERRYLLVEDVVREVVVPEPGGMFVLPDALLDEEIDE